ncbi:MAG: hypothetical protein AB1757_24605 [Acidobacteriota bacterium]
MLPNNGINSRTIKCLECHRPNPLTAMQCMWCGVPIADHQQPKHFADSRFELHYLGGLERLDSPLPVSFTVSLDGIEVKESMPGSRRVQIDAESIIEAHIINNIQKVKVEKRVALWRKLLLDDDALEKHKMTEQILYDYIITIRFRSGEKTCSAAFQSAGREGSSIVNKVARTINSLLRFKAIQVTE